MEKFIIPVPDVKAAVPPEKLLSALHLDTPGKKGKMADDVMGMYHEGIKIAKPVSVYSPLKPEFSEGRVWLNGVKIEESFVYEKLSSNDLVIPFVSTCGREIDEWSKSFPDMFMQFAVDAFKELCLDAARDELLKNVRGKYFNADKCISRINPGSLPAWPIKGQKPLFDILGDVAGDIGVVLTDSMMMKPTKSVSGIMFETDEEYHNCQLCPRADCPKRRAPFAS